VAAIDNAPRDRAPIVLPRRRIRISPILVATIGFILLLLVLGGVLTDRFLTTGNILNVLRSSVVTMLLGLGQTVVVLTGNIDLSVGAIISVSGSLVAGLSGGDNARLWYVLPVVLALCTGIGLINGLIVTKLRVHAIIATLGTGAVLQGLSLLYTPRPIVGPFALEDFAFGSLLGLPSGSFAAILLFLLTGFVLRQTRMGKKLYAVGGNPHAATLVGIPVHVVICAAFGFSGFCAGLTGIYMVGLLGSGSPIMGQGYELTSITPVVLGGTVLAGGVGGVTGTFFAAILISMLNSLLNFLQVSTFYQWVLQGAIIVLAVSLFSKRGHRA
jgi:ribose transport system permease protein